MSRKTALAGSLCSEGCGEAAERKGLCSIHYAQMLADDPVSALSPSSSSSSSSSSSCTALVIHTNQDAEEEEVKSTRSRPAATPSAALTDEPVLICRSCAVPGCSGEASKSSGVYCRDHKKYDSEHTMCMKPNCANKSFLGGYCASHYSDQEAITVVEEKGSANPYLLDKSGNVWQALTTKEGVEYYFNTETQQTTWDKPPELMTPEELDAMGSWYWVPDEKEAFLPGRLIADGAKVVMELEGGVKRTVPKDSIQPLQRSHLQRIVEDLVLLDRMSPPLILHNLKHRYLQNKIYTNVGTILISINPYQRLPIYTPQITQRYIEQDLTQNLAPHVFNIAYNAFYGVREFKKNQSIIISGESGAGKTEATKQCLGFLTSSAGSVAGIERKLLQANPILEAFGNAKTIRNDNSSRFGKYMEIFFNEKTEIACSGTRNYLLEKIRVSKTAPLERNFHIFYQLTKAADDRMRADFELKDPSAYRYLTTCIDVDTIDDKDDFKSTREAFDELSFSKEDQTSILSLVAAILNVGNIAFQMKSDSAVVSQSTAAAAATTAAKLFQVDVSQLIKAITSRELRVKGQKTTLIQLKLVQAEGMRDSLAKFVYGAMFDWIVGFLNKVMMPGGTPPSTSRMIGILDIFGFEIFEHNTFEQLCINFTNEMLQQHFNNQTFKLEEEVYKSEGIVFQHVDFIDNQPMLDLLTKRPTGVFPLLDEELVVPNGSDKGFVSKLHQQQSKNPVYEQLIRSPTMFVIRHYAGRVEYNTDGFMEKNRDTLTQDLIDMLRTSTHPLIKVLFPASAEELSTRDKKASLASQFQDQLKALMATLNRTEPHYIRCVKPNSLKKPDMFVPKMCYEQLTYSGVFEAVAIRKQGFPFRLTHPEFAERYVCICDNYHEVKAMDNKKEACQIILKELNLNKDNVQLGSSRVLYRADEYKQLELIRSIKAKKIEVLEQLEKMVLIDVDEQSNTEQEKFYSSLADAVKEADRYNITTPASKTARERLEAYVENRMDPDTKARLIQAVASRSRAQLEAVMKTCDEKSYRTKQTVQCQKLLVSVIESESALEIAEVRMEEGLLRRALLLCEELDFAQSEVYARCRLLLKKVVKAKVMIKAALASLDLTQLAQCIQACLSFGFITPELKQCQSLAKQIRQLRTNLKKGRSKCDRALLESVVSDCDKLGYRDPLVEFSRVLIVRIIRVTEEIPKAKRSYDVDHIDTVLKAANEIGLEDSRLDKLKKMMGTSRAKVIEKMYKKAVKKGDNATAIRLSVKKQDALVEKSGVAWDIHSFKGIRDPVEWAKGGQVFSISNKSKRADKMLEYEIEPLPNTVTDIFCPDPRKMKLLKQKAQQFFQTILMFMGQVDAASLQSDLFEMLRDCLDHPELRNELLMLIIKQMTKNPNFEAIDRGWQLIAVCLTVFYPTNGFENNLSSFIRSDLESSNQYYCAGLLAQRAYEGNIKPIDVPRFYRGTSVKKILEGRTPEYLQRGDDPETMNDTGYRDLKESLFGTPISGDAREQVESGINSGLASAQKMIEEQQQQQTKKKSTKKHKER